MAVFIGMSEEVKGKNYRLDGDQVTIGRAPANTIIIEHPAISGLHCRLTRDGDVYRIKDMGSTNGTRVNGRAPLDAPLKPGDLVQLGNLEFLYENDTPGGENFARPTLQAPAAVVEAKGPPTTPITFTSISPYGSRAKDSPTIWYVLITVLSLLALLGVAYVIYSLFLNRGT